MNEVVLVYALALVLAWPLGRYMAAVYAPGATVLDRVFGRVERVFYRLAGVNPAATDDWRGYGKAILKLHVFIGSIAFVIFYCQGFLPLNPEGIGGMSWDLALHTAASFLSNTDQQHYLGQQQLSYFAQCFGIVTLQVVTPMVGLAALVAIARTLLAGPGEVRRTEGGAVAVGNFYVDLFRGIVRIALPLAFITALALIWQGVPSTFDGARTVDTLDPAVALAHQRVPVGPVAPMLAIKQLGSNGGGWYGPNSAAPLENPTPVSNFIETVALILLPIATVIMIGYFTGRSRFAGGILALMLMLSFISSGFAIYSESQPNAAFAGLAQAGPNMEGKEVRFGATASALWGALATQTSNGSVNSMLDSWNPVGTLVLLMDMFINAIFGGIGVGLINFLLYILLAAFLGSLMIGRSPEFLGRALETKEIKLVSIALLLGPLLILGFTGATLALPALAYNSNPGFHSITEVLYEYTSAFANNGSGLGGLRNNTVWWNVTCAVVLILARFIPILAMLAVAARLAGKRAAPAGRGSLDVETLTFGALVVGVIVMFTLLSFMPILVIGPIGEALLLR